MCVDPRSCGGAEALALTCWTLKTSTSALAPAAAIGEVDRDAGDVVEQRQRIVRALREIAAVDVLHVVDGDRVDAVGETDKVVARAEIDRMTEALDRPSVQK